jgi:hypothetical protein
MVLIIIIISLKIKSITSTLKEKKKLFDDYHIKPVCNLYYYWIIKNIRYSENWL